MKPKSKKKRILFVVLSIIAILIIAGDWALTVMVYNENFNRRFESYEPLMLYVDDFDGLQRTKYEFTSNKGQKLTGYMYSSGGNQRGTIVMAHGFGGGGHNSYMDCADYFARHGYYVFAYDATGNDESEGEGVGGLVQGVIDLDHAITFVEESGEFPRLPIVLFGHSWGGYSVCSVLTYHPEVKAVIACSGFNASPNLFEAEGKKQAGNGIYLMLPFVKLIMKSIRTIPASASFLLKIKGITISMMTLIAMNLMRDLTCGSKRLTMTMRQRKTGNGFRRIKPVIYTKTLTGRNGVIHWIWSCSGILLIFIMNISISQITVIPCCRVSFLNEIC